MFSYYLCYNKSTGRGERKVNTIENIYVESWFITKNFNQQQQYAISRAESVEVIGETEKAAKVAWFTKYGTITSWVPKSVCGLAEKSEAAKKVEEEIEARAKAARERLEAAEKHYEAVLAFAKENKVKGARRGLKLRTLYAKIADAGLEFPEEETTTEEKATEIVEAVATEETATETTETTETATEVATEEVATEEVATEETASGFVTDEEKIEALKKKIIATATATVSPEGLTPADFKQRVLHEVLEVSRRVQAAFLANTMNKRLHLFWKAARLAAKAF